MFKSKNFDLFLSLKKKVCCILLYVIIRGILYLVVFFLVMLKLNSGLGIVSLMVLLVIYVGCLDLLFYYRL